jgi:hypothetical protein
MNTVTPQHEHHHRNMNAAYTANEHSHRNMKRLHRNMNTTPQMNTANANEHCHRNMNAAIHRKYRTPPPRMNTCHRK